MEKNYLYVYSPDKLAFVPAEEWLKEPDPTRAELIGIQTEKGLLAWAKKGLGDHSFDEAQRVAAAYKVPLFGEFRCPTRREFLDIQDIPGGLDALDELLDAIGGDTLRGDWLWTCERWLSRRNSASYGWLFSGTSGTLTTNYVYYANRVQAVTLLTDTI